MLAAILSCYCCLVPGLIKCYRNLTETRFSVYQAEAARVRDDEESRNESQRTMDSIPVVSVDVLDQNESEGEDGMGEEELPAIVDGRRHTRIKSATNDGREGEEKMVEAHLVSQTHREERKEEDDGQGNDHVRRFPRQRELSASDEPAPPFVSSMDEMEVETNFTYEMLRSLRGRGIRALRLR